MVSQRDGLEIVADDVGGVFRLVETYAHMRLRSQIIDLFGLHFFDRVPEAGAVGDIAVVQI